jgi:Ni2+-binding GTPase involved in maturation of urease and hydrogenase
MSNSLKIGIVGPQAAGKTTFFHQLYHNLPKEISGLGIRFFSHKTFDDVPIDSLVPPSFDSEALKIEGVVTLDRQQHDLQINDTLGGHLTDPSSEEVADELLNITQDLDMLILALDPKSVFGNQVKITHAVQKIIANQQKKQQKWPRPNCTGLHESR